MEFHSKPKPAENQILKPDHSARGGLRGTARGRVWEARGQAGAQRGSLSCQPCRSPCPSPSPADPDVSCPWAAAAEVLGPAPASAAAAAAAAASEGPALALAFASALDVCRAWWGGVGGGVRWGL